MNPNRKFRWISSKSGNEAEIEVVHKRLLEFYSSENGRHDYQQMVDRVVEMPKENEFGFRILDYVVKANPKEILEIGCGNGRFYRQLQTLDYEGIYKGIEVAEYVIEDNRKRHPEVEWFTAGAYSIPLQDEKFEMCFAYFVLEHLVYPEKALIEMLRVVKKSGKLVLVFPDFVAARNFPSQELGLSHLQTAKAKLQSGKIMDAIISLYDSRIRLQNALKNLKRDVGDFPINTNLVCFNHKDIMGPDIDAVYIASKNEIFDWASKRNLGVTFPCGVEGEFNDKAFIVIEKL